MSTKEKIIDTEEESLVKKTEKILDRVRKKVIIGKDVDHKGIKQQMVYNVNQFLEGVNKHLGIVENVKNTSPPLIGLDAHEGFKATA